MEESKELRLRGDWVRNSLATFLRVVSGIVSSFVVFDFILLSRTIFSISLSLNLLPFPSHFSWFSFT